MLGEAGLSMDWAAVREDAQAGLEKMGYNLPLYAPARSLSGGNLQRMVIIRELGLEPALDRRFLRDPRAGCAEHARRPPGACWMPRQAGAGVLLISEDLEELFTLSDRLIVLYEGRIVGDFQAGGDRFLPGGLPDDGIERSTMAQSAETPETDHSIEPQNRSRLSCAIC